MSRLILCRPFLDNAHSQVYARSWTLDLPHPHSILPDQSHLLSYAGKETGVEPEAAQGTCQPGWWNQSLKAGVSSSKGRSPAGAGNAGEQHVPPNRRLFRGL